MPTNPKEEFVWSSIDRSFYHDQLLQQSKEKIVSLSFENDSHPLGIKHSLSSSLVTKTSTKELKNSGKVKAASRNVRTKKESIFIDPLSAMSAAKCDEDPDDDVVDDLDNDDELGELNKLRISDKRYL